MDLLGRGLQWRGRACRCLMRNDTPCPSGTDRLCAYSAQVAGWDQAQILICIPQEQLLPQSDISCVRVLFLTRVNNVLQLPGLCFSLLLLFYWLCRSGSKAQDIKHDRGNPSPFVQNKISILGCCAGDWAPSLTVKGAEVLQPVALSGVFFLFFFLPSSI